MSNKIIRAALEAKLNTWAKAQTPPIPIAWQNATFTPPTQARYVRAFLLPAETQDLAITNDLKTYIGIFQVSVCVPEGSGVGAAEAVAESLITAFPAASLIQKLGVTILIRKTPSQATAMQETGLCVIPVSISYRADVTA